MTRCALLLLVVACGAAGEDGSFTWAVAETEENEETERRLGDPERMCDQDRDCVAARGMCGAWDPIHRDHQEDHEAAVREREVLADCVRERRPRPAVGCDEGRCVER
ncbi:MAG: hypothetical protein CMN30_10495 [Sandaracinus sp.]|nr:hypothetical protein [Sandaracinus sp.]